MKLFLILSTLCLITLVVADDTAVPGEDQLIVEEDIPHAYDQVDASWREYLKNKLIEIHTKVSSFGTNVATAKGIQKIAAELEILVFGPARVGTSTLIKQISGDETIETNARLDACTETSTKYIDKYNIRWWDTPGMRSSINQVEIF